MRFITALLAFVLLSFATVEAKTPVEGIVYLKNGQTMKCMENSKFFIPQLMGDLTVYKDYGTSQQQEEKVAASDIDSLICWSEKDSNVEYKFRFIPKSGWYWEYMSFAHINVLVYCYAGYGDNFFKVNPRVGLEKMKNKLSFFLERPDRTSLKPLGDATSKATNSFIRKICEFISDDPETVHSFEYCYNSKRSDVLKLLYSFSPKK
jgi:hypothetical protein